MSDVNFKAMIPPAIVVGGLTCFRQQLGSFVSLNPERLAPIMVEALGKSQIQAFIAGAGILVAYLFMKGKKH